MPPSIDPAVMPQTLSPSSPEIQSPLSPGSNALDSEGNIKVCIRVRPFNNREIANKCRRVVKFDSDGSTVELRHPEHKDKVYKFAYDRLYWSFDQRAKRRLATQEYIFRDMGCKLVQHALDGYNATLIAYGQTSSGKTHSLIGPALTKGKASDETLKKEGLVPRICRELFDRIRRMDAERQPDENAPENAAPQKTHVYFRMLEIYQEKVKDLLNPKYTNIKVSITTDDKNKRNIHISAPMQIVHSFSDIAYLMEKGNREKQIAETQMNERSSRSHTIFQLRIEIPAVGNKKRVSIINLVDLAGSENAKLAGTEGSTLKEGAAINKSLSALGHVIDELVSIQNKKKKKKKSSFISYRNSMLTSILANSLGGNAKTFMLCTISPSELCFSATKSTLRYGQKTKKIKNKAVVNEDSNVKLIRELRENIETLKKQITDGGSSSKDIENLQQQLEESRDIQKQLAATVEQQEKTQVEMEEIRQQLMNAEEAKHQQAILIEELRSKRNANLRNARVQTAMNMEQVEEHNLPDAKIEQEEDSVHSDSGSESVDSIDEDSEEDESHTDTSTDSSFDDFEIAEDDSLNTSQESMAFREESMKVPVDIDNLPAQDFEFSSSEDGDDSWDDVEQDGNKDGEHNNSSGKHESDEEDVRDDSTMNEDKIDTEPLTMKSGRGNEEEIEAKQSNGVTREEGHASSTQYGAAQGDTVDTSTQTHSESAPSEQEHEHASQNISLDQVSVDLQGNESQDNYDIHSQDNVDVSQKQESATQNVLTSTSALQTQIQKDLAPENDVDHTLDKPDTSNASSTPTTLSKNHKSINFQIPTLDVSTCMTPQAAATEKSLSIQTDTEDDKNWDSMYAIHLMIRSVLNNLIIQDSVHQFNSEIQTRDKSIQDYKEREQKLISENEKMKKSLEHVQENHRTASSKLDQVSTQLNENDEEISKLREKYGVTQQELDEFKQKRKKKGKKCVIS